MELKAVYIDLTVHLVDGTAGEVCFYFYGYFGIFVFGCQMEVMGTYSTDICQEVESRYPACRVDGTVQHDRTVFVIQRQLSGKAALFVLSVQGDIFVVVVTIVKGSDQPFQDNGRILLLFMVAVDVQIESYLAEFIVSQHLAQFEVFCFYGT